MKKWNLFSRFWHWTNVLLVVALFVTSLFFDTDVAESRIKLHVILGLVFSGLLFWRLLHFFSRFQKEKIKETRELIQRALKNIREHKMSLSSSQKYDIEKAGAKISYIGVFFCLFIMAATGLTMVLGSKLGIQNFDEHFFKEIHETFFIIIGIFSVIHIIGVIKAECFNEPGLVSDMINGGKKLLTLFALLAISSNLIAAEYKMEEVAKHNNEKSCWIVIDKDVYDVTSYLDKHPAKKALRDSCGKEVSQPFHTKKGRGKDHSPKAMKKKETFKIGTLSL